MANGDNLPYQTLDVVPFTPITSEWGDGVGDDILALAAGTGLDNGAVDTTQLADGAATSEKLGATIIARAYRSAAFNVTSSLAKVGLEAEDFDVGSDFDTTNNRFVAPVTGYYLVSGQVGTANIGDGNFIRQHIYINGASQASGQVNAASAGSDPTFTTTTTAYVEAGQYIELYAESNTTIPGNPGSPNTFLSVHFVGA